MENISKYTALAGWISRWKATRACWQPRHSAADLTTERVSARDMARDNMAMLN